MIIDTSKQVANPVGERTRVCLLLFAALLLVGLRAGDSLGADDVWSLHAVNHSHAQMLSILRADIHPPLYYELLYFWTRAFGASEIAVRGLSIALFLLSTTALYGWSRRLLGAGGALIATAIYVTSPLAIMAAGLARMYTLLSLLSILSTALYWVCFVEGGSSKRNLLWLILVNSLGSFTHVWFFFVLFAEGLHFIIFVRREWLRFATAYVAALVPYALLWLPDFLRQMKKSQEAVAWLTKPDAAEIGSSLFMYTGALLIFLPFLIFEFVRRRPSLPKWAPDIFFLLAAALLVPFALSYVKPVFYSRFTIVGLHLFAIVAAACVARIVNWQFPVMLCVLAAAWTIYGALSPQTCDARWTANYLTQQAGPNDQVIFTSLSREPVDYYLHAPTAFAETSFPADIDSHPGYEGNLLDPARRPRLEAQADALVDNLKQRHARVLFFHGFRPEIDAILETRLNRQLHVVKAQSVECNAMHCYFDTITIYQ